MRLNFLILLKTFQRLGYSITLARVPAKIIRHLSTSAQSPITQQDLSQYDASATRKRHLPIVCDYLQITAFGQKAHEAMLEALKRAVEAKYDLVDLINIAIEELVRQRFELPGFSTLERAARTVRKAHLEQLYQWVSEALTPGLSQHLGFHPTLLGNGQILLSGFATVSAWLLGNLLSHLRVQQVDDSLGLFLCLIEQT